MRYLIAALTLLATISTASAQSPKPEMIFINNKAVNVPSSETLESNIRRCAEVIKRSDEKASCTADMTVQHKNWERLVELYKHWALAKIVGDDFEASKTMRQMNELHVLIVQHHDVFRREWADVLGR